jgi:hypothetical protein
MGGVWVDPDVCDSCNAVANREADGMIARDNLVRFLRDAHRIRGRHGAPPPCRFAVRLNGGGVVNVTISDDGVTFKAAMSADALSRNGLASPADQDRLGEIVAQALGTDVTDGLALARAAQEFATNPTPPEAWSRFMAKLGLACGRMAYGDDWLDSPQAAILSRDLLSGEPPRFGQRTHLPPVESVWPYVPPNHQAWIETHDETAILMIALFGQVLGAVPVSSEAPPPSAYSAWTWDPVERSFRVSSFPAIWEATAAAKLTKEGHNVLSAPGQGFFYVADGPDGPAELPIPTVRAKSVTEAFSLMREMRENV